MWRALAIGLLVGCGGPVDVEAHVPDCVSACGLRTFGLSESCAEIDAVEASLVASFSDFWPAACSYLDGLTLKADPERLNALGYGDLVEPQALTVSVTDAPLRTGGAFVHAFVHIADWRDGLVPAGLEHEEWDTRGLLARINEWHWQQAR